MDYKIHPYRCSFEQCHPIFRQPDNVSMMHPELCSLSYTERCTWFHNPASWKHPSPRPPSRQGVNIPVHRYPEGIALNN